VVLRSQQLAAGDPENKYRQLCESCHGGGGAGGDRAPALINNRSLRSRSEAQIQELIRSGTPGGMPAFALLDEQLRPLANWVRSLNVSALDMKPAGDSIAGKEFFFGRGQCSTCHMVHGSGKSNGPDLSDVGRKSTLRELEAVLDNPTSQIGIHTTPTCPGWAFCPDESWVVVNVHLRSGATIRGFARNQSNRDIQLQDFQGKMHFLTSAEYDQITRENTSYMPPLKASAQERRDLIAFLSGLGGAISGPRPEEDAPLPKEAIRAAHFPKLGEWPNYNGGPGGNRYSALDQINRANVKRLQLDWVYSLPVKGLQVTPVVADGMMYVTAPGQVCAIDARSGREVWCYARVAAVAAGGGRNQGGANPAAGPNAAGRQPNRGSTVVGDRVLSGVAGGDGPLRGFLAAYKIPRASRPGGSGRFQNRARPGSETWSGVMRSHRWRCDLGDRFV
jgi:mono/diheme cytochrome c family protein